MSDGKTSSGSYHTFVSKQNPTCYEMGCEWDLAVPLYMRSLHNGQIIATDLVENVRFSLLNDSLAMMRACGLV